MRPRGRLPLSHRPPAPPEIPRPVPSHRLRARWIPDFRIDRTGWFRPPKSRCLPRSYLTGIWLPLPRLGSLSIHSGCLSWQGNGAGRSSRSTAPRPAPQTGASAPPRCPHHWLPAVRRFALLPRLSDRDSAAYHRLHNPPRWFLPLHICKGQSRGIHGELPARTSQPRTQWPSARPTAGATAAPMKISGYSPGGNGDWRGRQQ